MTSPPNKAPEHSGDLELVERHKTKRPRRYSVILPNADYTTMEFVVSVLRKFFRKTETEATHIMLNVHHRGYGRAVGQPNPPQRALRSDRISFITKASWGDRISLYRAWSYS
jgi:hypothetical protein